MNSRAVRGAGLALLVLALFAVEAWSALIWHGGARRYRVAIEVGAQPSAQSRTVTLLAPKAGVHDPITAIGCQGAIRTTRAVGAVVDPVVARFAKCGVDNQIAARRR